MDNYQAIIIGAGFSGIAMGIKLREKNIENFLILEKAESLGGTWRENTYPGAECDIPSALYSYSFEPYTEWEYKWSHQPQILQYLQHCADKYKISKKIKFKKELTSAHWLASESQWHISCADGTRYTSSTLITAIGQLHHPSYPSFKNQELFEGDSMHSAKWDHSLELKNKKVAVIGNGASAVQFIPQIVEDAAQITVFQRSANWMLPKQDRVYSQFEKNLVRRFPALLKIYRARIFFLAGALYLLMSKGNQWLRIIYQNKTINYIKKHISDPNVIKILTPDYPMGAKRILFSDDYYKALSRDNVTITSTPILSFFKNGIKTVDHSEYEFDVIIYATGFKTNPFLLNLDIRGKDNKAIQETWKDKTVNYKGISVTGFPNLFMMYGPNTNLGHNSIIIMCEAQAHYISECLSTLRNKNSKSMDVRQKAMEEYYGDIQVKLKNKIWNSIDKSWYISEQGEIANNWPERAMSYRRMLDKVDYSDYQIL